MTTARVRVFALVIAPALMLSAPVAAVADAGPTPDDLATRKTLLGGGGLRAAIQPFGLSLGLSETSEVLGNLTGGVRRGALYEGLTDVDLQFDLGSNSNGRASSLLARFKSMAAASAAATSII